MSATNGAARNEEVLETVTELILEVTGEDLELVGGITMATSFSQDLELESIEFVALAELIQQKYGQSVNFVSWISGKELDQIINLTVGDLVNFIVESTAGGAP